MFIVVLLLGLLFGFFALGSGSGSTTLESDMGSMIPTWAHQEGFAGNAQAVAGARLFAESGCTSCHTYLGNGSANLGAPDLSAEGKKGRGVRLQVAHLSCPSCLVPGSPMPSFKALGPRKLKRLAVFLEASRGGP